jgi:hypothetical protein
MHTVLAEDRAMLYVLSFDPRRSLVGGTSVALLEAP